MGDFKQIYTALRRRTLIWVAVKEFNLSDYKQEARLFAIYPCYNNLSEVPQQQPSNC